MAVYPNCIIKFGAFMTKYLAVKRQQRKAWDSNPRTNFTSVTSLARKRHQPLGQLSIADTFTKAEVGVELLL